MGPGLVIDDGNARYTDSRRRAATLSERGIHFIDAGVSGGIWGLREGFCIIAGGTVEDVVAKHRVASPATQLIRGR